jgi:uncharacterized Zn-finger protein
MRIIRPANRSTDTPQIADMQPFETVYVDDIVVACGGTDKIGGHPRVYLNLSGDGRIECPYCSRLFILREGNAGETDLGEARTSTAHPSPDPI